jgi:hypothetical protein
LKIVITRSDIIRGALIYSTGDTVASLILHEFMWSRLLGIMLIGATFYALEIPTYFRWIDLKTKEKAGFRLILTRTILAILYFNPLWIARHLAFIQISSGHIQDITWDILRVASLSFLGNIPVSLLANYIIQNKIHFRFRFFASAVFSALMAIYYALGKVLF